MPVHSKLFQPIRVGRCELQHRVVLAPLTRYKATAKTHVPHTSIVKEYYSQRGSSPGTLLVAEATFISPQAAGYDHAPGIWSDEQIRAWKEVTDAVHANGSFLFSQLWALGRAAKPEILRGETPPVAYVAPSPVQLTGRDGIPRALTQTEIKAYITDYARAASNAIFNAGFDGVEIHGASGYLIDQFLQDVSNKRTDEYGGSIENRTRFALEVVDAVVEAVGADRTGLRISPWNGFQDMRMEDPKPTFAHLVSQIKERHPDFAYIHVVEPRVDGVEIRDAIPTDWNNDFLRDIWSPRPFISAGGFEASSAKELADTTGNLVAFGRKFIANPDLPRRLKEGIPLTKADRATFYVGGDDSRGYTDYPFA
ncbi:FMN-linked oxidoreductase [Cylindrobasidium torrendii FP15055 ss-10]|uniref:FMN-linked oxidoreductase n=1 Tax=Cylindrobasidium torrendii FP15055 ss-10 TaxID=1314674 RepID=A0A0D7BBB6_9AGAR|nr:FMN-linked oxidoreductase [Cylindrobasidium torrendii FP15055 ss-10]